MLSTPQVCLFTYTHTNCKDVWKPYYNRLDKYFSLHESYSMVNDDIILPNNHKVLHYNDNLSYSDEFVRCLNQIPFDNFIYMQEDFILYNYPNIKELYRCMEYLNKSSLSFIRLIKCGSVTETKIDDKLYLISDSPTSHRSIDSFSMQPTIWKKQDFISLYRACNKYYFGEGYEYTNAMNNLGMAGAYYYDNEPKRQGSNHYDSSIFPYTATAIVKGKWNCSQYEHELDSVFRDYSIDKNLRGCV